MAVDLSKLVSKRRLMLDELNGKAIAIDAYNTLYQFLSIIRQPDGTPLMDSKGNVTSHLSGIFYRTIELIGYGIKPLYVFDGIPSMLKQKTIDARMRKRKEAYEAWQEAKKAGEIEEARVHAQASARVDKNILASSKRLLELMGVPYISAPSEGEAQASYMCKKGMVYATASQDYDTMLFGSTYVLRNLTFSGRRKLPNKNIFITVEPEILNLDDTLKSLGLNQKQLIWLGILLGTDFNAGIKGVGPKTALKIAKASRSIEDIENQIRLKFKEGFDTDIKEVEDLFTHPEVSEIDRSQLSSMFDAPYDRNGLVEFMCSEHGFSNDRIGKYADKLAEVKRQSKQKGMEKWLK
jgi:flap endonuclease-1